MKYRLRKFEGSSWGEIENYDDGWVGDGTPGDVSDFVENRLGLIESIEEMSIAGFGSGFSVTVDGNEWGIFVTD